MASHAPLLLATVATALSTAVAVTSATTLWPSSVLTVNTTNELRAALDRPFGRIELRLPEGRVFQLNGLQLRIHNVNASLRSEGTGAILDAQGISRHFDVALGGELHLERVHLIHGGSQVTGGTALVRFGGRLTATDLLVGDSEAVMQGGAVAAHDYNAALEEVRRASSGGAQVMSAALSPDGSRIVSGDWSGNVIVWEAATLKQLVSKSSGASQVLSVCFSRDDPTRLVYGDSTGDVNVWSWMAHLPPRVHLHNTSIARASASTGGGIFLGTGSASVAHSTINGCLATASGAALAVDGGNLTLDDVWILENRAGAGAAALLRNASFDIRNTSFTRNNATIAFEYQSANSLTPSVLAASTFDANEGAIAVRAFAPIEWTCELGQWMSATGTVWEASFSGCPHSCVAGFVGNITNATDQTCGGPCPAGHVCPEGTTTEPQPCPNGFHLPTVGAGSNASCIPCSPGQHGAGKGRIECASCDPGSFSDEAGATECKPCPLGGYCEAARASSVKMAFEQCPEGTYGNTTGLSNASQCAPCPNGHWCRNGTRAACGVGSYTDPSADRMERSSLAACMQCPYNSTTARNGSTSADDCVCSPGFFLDLRAPNATCVTCPAGFRCPSPARNASLIPREQLGRNTTSALVDTDHWRPSTSSAQAKLCPHPRTCSGGPSPDAFLPEGSVGCVAPFTGAYCEQCAKASDYFFFDAQSVGCRPCFVASIYYGSILLGAVVVALLLLLVCTLRAKPSDLEGGRQAPEGGLACGVRLARLCARVDAGARALASSVEPLVAAARRMYEVASAVTLGTKLKICLGVSQVVAQLKGVYQLRYPRGYQSISARFFAPLTGALLDWIPGLHMHCIGLGGLQRQLLVYTSLPLAVIGLIVAWSLQRHRSLVPALPFLLRFTYLIYPSISSKGFQALGQCDCFDDIDGTSAVCVLPSDVSIQCTVQRVADSREPGSTTLAYAEDGGVRALAWLAVLVYGLGVPSLYCALLARCRHDIQAGASTPLSDALAFLHAAFEPRALWWPLVEALRAVLLTGFLALASPGTVTQLFLGVLVALACALVQIWSVPYRAPENNLVAAVASAGLVLSFIASLGVQVNAHAPTLLVRQELLSAVLFVAAFAVFVVTLLSFLNGLRRRPRRPASPSDAPEPLLAPCGEQMVNSEVRELSASAEQREVEGQQ